MPFRIFVQSLLFSICIGLFLAPAYAQDEKTRQLLKRLKQPVPAYQPPTVKNAVPPHLLAKQGYEVSWLKAPYLRFSDAELQRAKTVIVQMTVIANTGRITDVEIIQSSGLRVVDAKVKEAVLAALVSAESKLSDGSIEVTDRSKSTGNIRRIALSQAMASK